MSQALKALINNINSQLQSLNGDNFKIYDEDNPEFYIDSIYYRDEDNSLYFKCKEEEV